MSTQTRAPAVPALPPPPITSAGLLTAIYTLRAYAPAVVDGVQVAKCVLALTANAAEFPAALAQVKSAAESHVGGSYHILRQSAQR